MLARVDVAPKSGLALLNERPSGELIVVDADSEQQAEDVNKVLINLVFGPGPKDSFKLRVKQV